MHDVRIFLGLTSYYRRFAKNYADIANPLYGLTKKDADFEWGENQERAFVILKKELTGQTELAYPQAGGGSFILDTDASNVVIGATLSQVHDGKKGKSAGFWQQMPECSRAEFLHHKKRAIGCGILYVLL